MEGELGRGKNTAKEREVSEEGREDRKMKDLYQYQKGEIVKGGKRDSRFNSYTRIFDNLYIVYKS